MSLINSGKKDKVHLKQYSQCAFIVSLHCDINLVLFLNIKHLLNTSPCILSQNGAILNLEAAHG